MLHSATDTLRHYAAHLKNRTLPCEHVIWHVTNRCNLACVHCGVWGGEKQYADLSLEDFARNIPNMIRLGVKYVTLTGGEPLLRKDIGDILAVLKLSGFKVAMVTNGHYLERFADKLTPYPLDSISISIDGGASFHNAIRLSETSYAETLSALRVATQLDIQVRNVNTCVTPENLSSLKALAEDIFAAGANHWILRPVSVSGRATEMLKPDMDVLRDLLKFAARQLEKGLPVKVAGIGYMGPWHDLFYEEGYLDHTGWKSLYILPDGGIKGFNDDQLPLEGHLLKDDLEDLWWNRFELYRHRQVPEDCLNCNYFEVCGGGNHTEAEASYRCIKPLFGDFSATASPVSDNKP